MEIERQRLLLLKNLRFEDLEGGELGQASAPGLLDTVDR